MHHRISNTLHALRQDLAARLGDDVILAACRAAGHTWCDSCLLTPAAIIHWFLIQVFHGNTALTHVSLLAGRAFSAAPSARPAPGSPWPSSAPRSARSSAPDPRHPGHRPLARPSHLPGQRLVVLHARHPGVAGALRPAWQPGRRVRLPRGPPAGAFHAGTGLLLEVNAAPLRTQDFAGLAGVLGWLTAGDVLVADPGFCSFASLALVISQGIHAVFRLHQKQIVDFTPGRAHAHPRQKGVPKGMPRSRWIRAYGLTDQLVEYFKPAQRPERISTGSIRPCPSRSWCGNCGIGSRCRGFGRGR